MDGFRAAGVTVLALSSAVLEARIAELVILDELMLRTHGSTFSSEAWSEEHFRRRLPLKDELSQIALSGPRLVGYWIASGVPRGTCHTHRVAVAPDASRTGVASRMFDRVLAAARMARPPISSMTLEVGIDNAAARRFYAALGFADVGSARIRGYLADRGRTARVGEGWLEEADGSRFVVMERAA